MVGYRQTCEHRLAAEVRAAIRGSATPRAPTGGRVVPRVTNAEVGGGARDGVERMIVLCGVFVNE